MPQNPQWLVNQYPHDLKAQIKFLVNRGYTVVSQTDKTAQLIKKKHFSFLIAILGLLLWGVGLIIYIIYYISKKDETIYLDLEAQVPTKPKD